MIMKTLIEHSLEEALMALQQFCANDRNISAIEAAAHLCADCLRDGGKIISCGNGGSLCDATHFAEELTGRFRMDRNPMPAISINDPAYLTCTGNDYSFEDCFARYVQGVGHEGDVLLAISTTGNSTNVLRAASMAIKKGMKVIALTSSGGNDLSQMANVAIEAPKTAHSDRIQEIHIKVIHILIEAIEAELFSF